MHRRKRRGGTSGRCRRPRQSKITVRHIESSGSSYSSTSSDTSSWKGLGSYTFPRPPTGLEPQRAWYEPPYPIPLIVGSSSGEYSEGGTKKPKPKVVQDDSTSTSSISTISSKADSASTSSGSGLVYIDDEYCGKKPKKDDSDSGSGSGLVYMEHEAISEEYWFVNCAKYAVKSNDTTDKMTDNVLSGRDNEIIDLDLKLNDYCVEQSKLIADQIKVEQERQDHPHKECKRYNKWNLGMDCFEFERLRKHKKMDSKKQGKHSKKIAKKKCTVKVKKHKPNVKKYKCKGSKTHKTHSKKPLKRCNSQVSTFSACSMVSTKPQCRHCIHLHSNGLIDDRKTWLDPNDQTRNVTLNIKCKDQGETVQPPHRCMATRLDLERNTFLFLARLRHNPRIRFQLSQAHSGGNGCLIFKAILNNYTNGCESAKLLRLLAEADGSFPTYKNFVSEVIQKWIRFSMPGYVKKFSGLITGAKKDICFITGYPLELRPMYYYSLLGADSETKDVTFQVKMDYVVIHSKSLFEVFSSFEVNENELERMENNFLGMQVLNTLYHDSFIVTETRMDWNTYHLFDPYGNGQLMTVGRFYETEFGLTKRDYNVYQPVIKGRRLVSSAEATMQIEPTIFLLPQFCFLYGVPTNLFKQHNFKTSLDYACNTLNHKTKEFLLNFVSQMYNSAKALRWRKELSISVQIEEFKETRGRRR